VTYNPRKIYGSWAEGWVLDLHTSSSTYVGDDEFGHPQFETIRTEIGELLFKLKYRNDEGAMADLVDAAEAFIASWRTDFSVIVPVPPTRTYRVLQPVLRLASAVGARLGVAVAADAVRKLRSFSELKNVYDAEERRKLLEGAFEVKPKHVSGERVLLFDDLYRSGATMNAIAERIAAAGASQVFAFAFTQTRSRA
jgi:predicted amidophosphoribosyltransferase